jgi:hypothetical protein
MSSETANIATSEPARAHFSCNFLPDGAMRQEEDLAAGNIFPRIVPPRVMYDSVGINIDAVRFSRIRKTSRRANISGLTHTICDGAHRCVYAFAILRRCTLPYDHAENFPAAFNI